MYWYRILRGFQVLTFSKFLILDQGKRSGLTRSTRMEHHGSCWFPIFMITNSHTGFALYCRILTFMMTTWFMHEYCSISI